jgi:hypothetical protein
MKKYLIGIVICIGILALIGVDWQFRAYYSKRVCDGYPYMYADKGDLAEGKGAFRIWLASKGGISCDVSIWLSPAEAKRDANNPLYWSMPKYRIGKTFIYEGSVLIDNDIMNGEYIVELSTGNGTYIEYWEILNKVQSIAVYKGNNKIYVE